MQSQKPQLEKLSPDGLLHPERAVGALWRNECLKKSKWPLETAVASY